MSQAINSSVHRQAAPLLKAPDLLTFARIPLAVIFIVVSDSRVRLGVVVLAGVSDVMDGIWARRIGGSRAGAILDPVTDKLFMLATFGVVLMSRALTLVEVLGVLLRDITAAFAFLMTVVAKRPTTLPARAGGKAVTILQGLTLLAFLAGSDLLRPLAWATAAVSIYAIYDYSREAWRP